MEPVIGIEPSKECPEKKSLLARLLHAYRSDFCFVPRSGRVLEVPCELIREDIGSVAIPIYIHSAMNGSQELVLGVDPGERHVGIAALVGDYEIIRETIVPESFPLLLSVLSRFFAKVIIYIGDYPDWKYVGLDLHLGDRVVVRKLREKEVKKVCQVVSDGDKGLSRHARDAYFLLLSGVAETLRKRLAHM
ncbi:MAG: hypothetical protein LM590_02585 [Thermofilum sp.]|jgi:hypothetical protein|nr:hypothetical protein [Thermofilum sp.]